MPRINSTNWSVGDEIQASRLQDINEDIDNIYSAGDDRIKVYRALSGTPLKIDVGAGNYLVGTTHGNYAGQTDLSVTDENTNYVMIDSLGVIQISLTARNVNYARLATVVCTGGVITSIVDQRNDVLGGSLFSFDINGQLEKIEISNNDEFLIGDSEDSNANKKITLSNMRLKRMGFSRPSSVSMIYNDNTNIFACTNITSVILYNPSGNQIIRDGNVQNMGGNTISGSSSGRGVILQNGRVYFAIYVGSDTKLYSCDITNDITVAGNRSLDFTITGQNYSLVGYDGYFCFSAYSVVDKNIYRYNSSGVAQTTLSFPSLPYNIVSSGLLTLCYPGVYLLCVDTTNFRYARNSSDIDISGFNGYIGTNQCHFAYIKGTLFLGNTDSIEKYYRFPFL